MRDWAVLGRVAEGWRGYAMSGDDVVAERMEDAPDAVLKALDRSDAETIRVGEGSSDMLPAAVLPGNGRTLPALEQTSPADVISGWARLWMAGFLAQRRDWDGVICAVHGDVAHWCHISADEVVSAQGSLTPRLARMFAYGEATPDETALSDTLSRPERLAHCLRVAEVEARPDAMLGYLLGAELAATRSYWLGQRVGVIADEPRATAYAQALESQGVPVEPSAPDALMPQGLAALGARLGLTG